MKNNKKKIIISSLLSFSLIATTTVLATSLSSCSDSNDDVFRMTSESEFLKYFDEANGAIIIPDKFKKIDSRGMENIGKENYAKIRQIVIPYYAEEIRLVLPPLPNLDMISYGELNNQFIDANDPHYPNIKKFEITIRSSNNLVSFYTPTIYITPETQCKIAIIDCPQFISLNGNGSGVDLTRIIQKGELPIPEYDKDLRFSYSVLNDKINKIISPTFNTTTSFEVIAPQTTTEYSISPNLEIIKNNPVFIRSLKVKYAFGGFNKPSDFQGVDYSMPSLSSKKFNAFGDEGDYYSQHIDYYSSNHPSVDFTYCNKLTPEKFLEMLNNEYLFQQMLQYATAAGSSAATMKQNFATEYVIVDPDTQPELYKTLINWLG